MAEATMKAALVKAKGDAEAWFMKMTAAVTAAREIMAQKNASDLDDLETVWKTLRTENQTLLYLREDQFFIGEELKKVQHIFGEYHIKSENLKTNIVLLQQTLGLAIEGKVRSMETFERKEQEKETEIDSIKNEISTLTINPCFGDSDSVKKRLQSLIEKKASLEEKIRCYREREANELASFDSKISESEEDLGKKTSKLKKIEQKVVVMGETLKLMKDARRCCEEAITMFNLVFVHRLWELKADFVPVDETSDVGIIKRIYQLKDHFGGGFELDFVFLTIDLCAEISKIFAIDVEHYVHYRLSIDNQGLCHIFAN